MDQAHLIEAMDKVMRRLGGTAHVWRTDRLATVIVPGTRDVQPSFAPVAKHYGAIVEPCPPRRGNRKGSVESSVRFCSGRWWRTMTAKDPESAQISLDRFLATTGDVPSSPGRRTASARRSERWLMPSRSWRFHGRRSQPRYSVERTVADNAAVAFRGNRYSVPPGLSGAVMELRHRLGTASMEVHSPSGALVATHLLAPAGAGVLQRSPEHRAALEAAVLEAFTTQRPCDRKANRPPGPEALAEAARLLGPEGTDPTVDLDTYAALVEQRA